MSKPLSLGDRMKQYYEAPAQSYLPRRTNAIIRLDGVAFSKFTRGLDKPYDLSFVNAMNSTAAFLCKNIQGAKVAFVQSDEITILVTDYDTNDTHAWFGYTVQKIVSVAAGMATAHFNQVFRHKVKDTPGYFDARVFSIPFAEEVVNCFLWRQQDCTRNSIAMLAQSLYTHGKPGSELHGKSSDEQKEMIYERREVMRPRLVAHGIISGELAEKESLQWGDLPSGLKRGRIVLHKEIREKVADSEAARNNPKYKVPENGEVVRRQWVAEGAPRFETNREILLSLMSFEPIEDIEDVVLPVPAHI